MELRLLHAKEAKAYWNLRLTALKESPEAFLLTLEEELNRSSPIKAVSTQLKDPFRMTIGCFNSEELIGTITLQREVYTKLKHKGNILLFYIKKEYRNQGLGRKMLQSVIALAKEHKLEQLILSVVSTNKKATNLYESFGFKIFGKELNALKYKGAYLDESHMILYLK
ncbi:GNAT family N-acetyltransferase [Bacillus sp. B1-b2]|uniref:GNAT family N-acetyltransferase n=1 Tax=Bacillus sp. B1-b2 TaxID=2653201 RepID=UPI00126259C6|nr:GNAT family N-acetyltransferase [Bacillus sp. B1-b2]KAB7673160.1 GNAT family N-acetyltransferase [Bacillus sp. B1-b2]